MGFQGSWNLSRARMAAAIAAMLVALGVQAVFAGPAHAEGENLAAAAAAGQAQELTVEGTGQPASATLTTDDAGEAWLTLTVGEAGRYSICSTASQGVDGDTVGYLYDASQAEIEAGDDCHADTNFLICADLAAGEYSLKVTGKELQPGASIAVSARKGQALGSLDYTCDYEGGDSVAAFSLGTWEHGESTEWVAADASSYSALGYVERSVFAHAQENDAVSKLAWESGLPKQRGRYVVMLSAQGSTYFGNAYFNLDEKVDFSSIGELDPELKNEVCGATASVELGKYTTVPTNWSTRWDAITAGYYDVVGYCARERFEALGGDGASISWTRGMPHDEGSYVVKLQASDADENPYTGSCYVWASVVSPIHAGSGSWIVDAQPTYSKEGRHHLACMYCGAACGFATIPMLKDALETAGSGAALADYKVLSANTVRYEACLTTKKTVKVPDTVTIDGEVYSVVEVAPKAFSGKKTISSVTVGNKVKSLPNAVFSGLTKLKTVKIGKKVASVGKNAFKGCKALSSVTLGVGVTKIGATAFSGCKKLKTLTLKTSKLKKSGVKNCLKGSSVKTLKVPKAKKKAYAKLFVKKVCGVKAQVK